MMRPTHFLSLALGKDPMFAARVDRLLATWRGTSLAPADRVLQPGPRTHLTLGVLALSSAEDVSRAADKLHQAGDDVRAALNGASQLTIAFSSDSLGWFGGRAQKCRVAFAAPRQDTALVTAINAVRQHFNDAGLLLDAREFTLHCTLANASKGRPKRPMDITGLLELTEELRSLGEACVDAIELCALGSYTDGRRSPYVAIATIPFSSSPPDPPIE